MLSSKIVGMDCPGLNSLFSGLNIHFEVDQCPSELTWIVERHTLPIAPIRIAVSGGGLCGHLEAFYRPTVVKQASIEAIRNNIDKGIFNPKLLF